METSEISISVILDVVRVVMEVIHLLMQPIELLSENVVPVYLHTIELLTGGRPEVIVVISEVAKPDTEVVAPPVTVPNLVTTPRQATLVCTKTMCQEGTSCMIIMRRDAWLCCMHVVPAIA